MEGLSLREGWAGPRSPGGWDRPPPAPLGTTPWPFSPWDLPCFAQRLRGCLSPPTTEEGEQILPWGPARQPAQRVGPAEHPRPRRLLPAPHLPRTLTNSWSLAVSAMSEAGSAAGTWEHFKAPGLCPPSPRPALQSHLSRQTRWAGRWAGLGVREGVTVGEAAPRGRAAEPAEHGGPGRPSGGPVRLRRRPVDWEAGRGLQHARGSSAADGPLREPHCAPYGEHPVVCRAPGEMNSWPSFSFPAAYQGMMRRLSPPGRGAPSHRLPAPPGRRPSPGRGPHSRGGMGRQEGLPVDHTALPLPLMLGLVSLPS